MCRKLGDSEGIPIYNYVSSAQNPIQWHDFVDMAKNHGKDVPSSKAIWYYSFTMTKYKVLYVILSFLLHTLPALLVDTVTILCFKKPNRTLQAVCQMSEADNKQLRRQFVGGCGGIGMRVIEYSVLVDFQRLTCSVISIRNRNSQLLLKG
ncbi:unnamed protein product [Timema podura]|uniref:Uncharacterized protein n=1 Tax=Timema podura TaxID=61482 RepID=A0ABN7P113_TIMPD|nr:unnamed protein product [Timema podura]